MTGSHDRGDTLVEILISIVIMGIAGIAIITALSEGVYGSVSHRDAARAETAMRYVSESVQSSATAYDACTVSPAHSATYSVSVPAAFTGLTPSLVKTEYWDDINSKFSSTCPTDGDRGLQRLTLKVASADGRVNTTVQIIKRNTGYAP